MHICFLTNEYPKTGFPHGGVGSFVKTMAAALVAKGNQVTVVGLNYVPSDETENGDGVNVIRIRKSKVKGLAWYFNSRRIAKTIAAIHSKNPIHILEGAESAFAFLPKIKGISYVIRLHGGHHFFAEAENRGIAKWKGFQEKRSFAKADAFVAVSRYVKSHTAKYLSYHNKPIEVIFNPINHDLFHPIAMLQEANNITFAGTICEKKGVRQLLQAFRLVKEHFPNAVLNLYGRDWFFPDGRSYIKMLQETVLPELGVFSKDVHFHGAIAFDAIPGVYAKAAVCVFPSHMETLGLVAPEAMAMEKVVIFTALGPGPEVIVDGQTGFLCNPHDATDLASKIIYVLKHQEAVVSIGKQARISVLKQFEKEAVLTKNIRFYRGIATVL